MMESNVSRNIGPNYPKGSSEHEQPFYTWVFIMFFDLLNLYYAVLVCIPAFVVHIHLFNQIFHLISKNFQEIQVETFKQ